MIVCHDTLTEGLHTRYRYELVLRDTYQAMQFEIARLGLIAGRDMIVDRNHLTRSSRRIWVDAAHEWQVPIVAIVFPIQPAEIHAMRRFDHDPRGRSFEDWLMVAHHHESEREPLDPSEGFDRIEPVPDVPEVQFFSIAT